MNRKYLLQLAIFALVSPLLIARAQQGPAGILHGVVVREGTSEPIRDAQISAGPQFKASTDRDGRFTIEGLPAGPILSRRNAKDTSRRMQTTRVRYSREQRRLLPRNRPRK